MCTSIVQVQYELTPPLRVSAPRGHPKAFTSSHWALALSLHGTLVLCDIVALGDRRKLRPVRRLSSRDPDLSVYPHHTSAASLAVDANSC
eukprot:3279042-Amphidinium_carterae.2